MTAVLSDAPCAAWFILRTYPMRERAAAVMLTRMGCECWYPTVTAWRRVRRAAPRKIRYDARVAPGYLFVRPGHVPHWHRLRELTETAVVGVVMAQGAPVALSDADVAAMAQVPHRLLRLRRKLLSERARMLREQRPEAGDRAIVLDGAFEGWSVDVVRMDSALAQVVIPLLGAGRRVDLAPDLLLRVG